MKPSIMYLGLTVLVCIALYIAYILFLRDEGFTVTAAETQAMNDKAAAILALATATSAKAAAASSLAAAQSAEKEVGRLQKVANKAASADKVSAQAAVTAAAAIASTKVGTAATDRATAITTATASATAAAAYARSAAVVASASKKTSEDAEVAKASAIRNNSIATRNAADAAAAIAAPPNPPLAATVSAKTAADSAAAAALALVTSTTSIANAAASQYSSDKAAADAALTASEVAAKFLDESKKETTRKDARYRSKNNPALSRDLGKMQPKPVLPPVVFPKKEDDTFFSSAMGGFLGAGFGSLLGSAVGSSMNNEMEYRHSRISGPPNSKYTGHYKEQLETEWTHGGASPSRRFADDYNNVSEFNDSDPDAMRWQRKNIDTSNLHSVDCNDEPRQYSRNNRGSKCN